MCCLPSKGVFFPCFGDAGGQIYNIYLDNNLNDYLMLDLRCLGAGNDLLLFSTSCPARRRPAWRLLAGAGQVKEVSQRIDQCSCYLLHISMFLCIVILLMHYNFVVQSVVCCYFLCPWYTVPSRSQFSIEYFCALPILQSKEPPQEEVSAAFLSPPKCNISAHKKYNIIVGLKRQRRHVLFPKRSCTIAKD